MTAPPLVVERVVAAPAEMVFAAWTEPEVLRRWWAAGPDWNCALAEVDLREGGRYRLAMRGPSGEEHAVGGGFVEVARPRRLVYTWAWEGPSAGPESLVTVEFREAEGGATRVVVTHEGLAGRESRDRHRTGWQAVLGSLAGRGLPRDEPT